MALRNNRRENQHQLACFLRECIKRAAVLLGWPVSCSRRNSRLSFASLRQIFTRSKKSLLLSASSASIQFAATSPDARTNGRTSSTLLIVLGNCLTKLRIDSANRNVRSSRSRGFAPSSIWKLGFGCLLGTWDLFVIWSLGFGACRICCFDDLLRCIRQIVGRDQLDSAFL